jgi:protein LTV1
VDVRAVTDLCSKTKKPNPHNSDKSKATTYQLVHRPQNDPLIHDASSSSMVFQEVAPAQARKGKSRRDLENELFGGSELGSVIDGSSDAGSLFSTDEHAREYRVRDNEGEAAEHGIYYDDTEYDYMQHMRDLGASTSRDGGVGDGFNATAAVWIPVGEEKENKGKQKQSLADALAALDLEHEQAKNAEKGKLVDPAILPSSSTQLRRTTYQDQQDVPDVLAGFQPDMDPRLREVLEALDDEAYVDSGESDDFFASIVEGKQELSLAEFEDDYYNQFGVEGEVGEWEDHGDEDEGWESDRTARPGDDMDKVPNLVEGSTSEPKPTLKPSSSSSPPSPSPSPSSSIPPPTATTTTSSQTASEEDGAFMATFHTLPSAVKNPTPATQQSLAKPAASILSSSVASSSFLLPGGGGGGGKRKKRKGAKTSTSSFSMTSSSIARTEGLQTLDARFDRVLEAYAEEDGENQWDEDDGRGSVVSGVSGVSGISGMSGLSRFSTMSSSSSSSSRRSAMQELVNRKDFSHVMDEFLAGHQLKGKRRVRKGSPKTTGLQELDDIRTELRGGGGGGGARQVQTQRLLFGVGSTTTTTSSSSSTTATAG